MFEKLYLWHSFDIYSITTKLNINKKVTPLSKPILKKELLDFIFLNFYHMLTSRITVTVTSLLCMDCSSSVRCGLVVKALGSGAGGLGFKS